MTDIEENAYNIAQNKRQIEINRALTVISALLIIALVAAVSLNIKHDIHACENKLSIHLFGEEYDGIKGFRNEGTDEE